MAPIVLLTGFSIAGKSTLLKPCKKFVKCIDTDELVAERAGFEHIYDIFMARGPKEATHLIEQKENEILHSLSNLDEEPLLIAAGPFLMIRENWESFHEKRNPFVVHLMIDEKNVYRGLMGRRNNQMKKMDQSNPFFGSWDNDVTTTMNGEKYIDVPQDEALQNIKKHLMNATGIYYKYDDCRFESMKIRRDPSYEKAAIDTIKENLFH